MACAGNPSHCKRLRVFKTLEYSHTSVGTPTTMLSLSKTVLCDSLLLDSEYSESSGDSCVSAGTPELQLSNTFINVLSLSMMHVERLPSEF